MCLCAHTYIYKSKLMSLFLLVSQVTAGATLPHQLQYIYPREQDYLLHLNFEKKQRS